MWWNSYWPTAWIFLGPLMMVLCMGMMFLMMRGMHHHRASAAPGWTGVGPSYRVANSGKMQAAASPAFDEYRADTLRRLEEEQAEFQRFLDQLRAAKDKVEFDQFMSARRTASQASS